MSLISASVGRSGVNKPADVQWVQQRIAIHTSWLDVPAPTVTGKIDDRTQIAIINFQKNAAVLAAQDGQVSSHGFTVKQLTRDVIPKPVHPIFRPACFVHSTIPLNDDDYASSAKAIGCEAAMVEALANTEDTDWDKSGGPGILFERHKFSAHTKGLYNSTHPDISNNHAGAYGLLRKQYSKLWRAGVLDEIAALKSCSWGKFQILGENFVAAGFDTVGAMVTAMMISEQEHLKAATNFILSSKTLTQAMIDRDWINVSIVFNGKNYAATNYNGRLEAAYNVANAKNKIANRNKSK